MLSGKKWTTEKGGEVSTDLLPMHCPLIQIVLINIRSSLISCGKKLISSVLIGVVLFV
jgi:hypothetical protein